MQLLDLTLESPEENLALDEALLEEAEAGGAADDVLRLWESHQIAVVIGRSSRIEDEVDLDQCQRDSVPVLRRCSGGTSVVIGPGCLMYGVVLQYDRYPTLRMVDAAHQYVLGNVAEAIRQINPAVLLQGTSDLTLGDRKFSGNSLRCKRDHLLYHGTLLYDFSLDLISRYLKSPPRQPDYRQQRNHKSFVMNLELTSDNLRSALLDRWKAFEPLVNWPRERTSELVRERYGQSSWHQRL